MRILYPLFSLSSLSFLSFLSLLLLAAQANGPTMTPGQSFAPSFFERCILIPCMNTTQTSIQMTAATYYDQTGVVNIILGQNYGNSLSQVVPATAGPPPPPPNVKHLFDVYATTNDVDAKQIAVADYAQNNVKLSYTQDANQQSKEYKLSVDVEAAQTRAYKIEANFIVQNDRKMALVSAGKRQLIINVDNKAIEHVKFLNDQNVVFPQEKFTFEQVAVKKLNAHSLFSTPLEAAGYVKVMAIFIDNDVIPAFEPQDCDLTQIRNHFLSVSSSKELDATLRAYFSPSNSKQGITLESFFSQYKLTTKDIYRHARDFLLIKGTMDYQQTGQEQLSLVKAPPILQCIFERIFGTHASPRWVKRVTDDGLFGSKRVYAVIHAHVVTRSKNTMVKSPFTEVEKKAGKDGRDKYLFQQLNLNQPEEKRIVAVTNKVGQSSKLNFYYQQEGAVMLPTSNDISSYRLQLGDKKSMFSLLNYKELAGWALPIIMFVPRAGSSLAATELKSIAGDEDRRRALSQLLCDTSPTTWPAMDKFESSGLKKILDHYNIVFLWIGKSTLPVVYKRAFDQTVLEDGSVSSSAVLNSSQPSGGEGRSSGNSSSGGGSSSSGGGSSGSGGGSSGSGGGSGSNSHKKTTNNSPVIINHGDSLDISLSSNIKGTTASDSGAHRTYNLSLFPFASFLLLYIISTIL